ncbi:MAG: c-type cytochrome [Gemmatimonadota bacterium]
MFDIFGVSVLVGLAALFGWLTRRAWQTNHPVLKWSGAVFAGLLTFVFTAAVAAALLGYAKLNRKHDNPASLVSVEVTPERIAKGERFASLCAGCHAADESPPLEGKFFLEDAPPIGRFYAPNLTPIHLGEWTDGEIIRAIREGVHRSGRSLLIMPSTTFRHLSDEDVHAIVAYLRSQPPIGPDTPTNRLNVLGALVANIAPIFEVQPPITAPIVAPPAGPTAAHGEYLASWACAACHGADLAGEIAFGAPGLAAAGQFWTEEHFIHFIRSGERPSGPPVDAELMPWEDLSEFFTDDDELRAIFAHLGTVGG